jgi:flagellar biosynthesis protein FlhF
MRLKSFTARTMKDAMQMIRDTLGENAILVATREEPDGRVTLTAALDDDEIADLPRSAAETPWEDEDESTVVEEVTGVMLRHAVPESVLEAVVSTVNVMGLGEARNALYAALQNLFEFKPLPQKTYGKPLILVGPPGAGKTLAAAKIAARGALSGLKMGVVTTDVIRAGGVEQLAAFTRLMKIDLQKASDPRQLQDAVQAIGKVDQVVIDTAGVNPFDPESIKPLARLIGAVECDPVLVIPAGIDADESGEMARVFSMIGSHSMVPTRVDVARRLGSLLSAAYHGGLAFAEVSNTAKVADGLSPLSAKRLTQMLMPRAEDASALANARKAG